MSRAWVYVERARNITGFVAGIVAVPTCIFGYARLVALKPVPELYPKATVSTGPGDLDAPRQPMVRLKFGNAGVGPLIVSKLELLQAGRVVHSWKEAIGPLPPGTTFKLVNESESLVTAPDWSFRGRTIAPGAFVEMARIYPCVSPAPDASAEDSRVWVKVGAVS